VGSLRRSFGVVVFFLAACGAEEVTVAPTVANPTARDVSCRERSVDSSSDDAGAPLDPGAPCQTTFDGCSDGLSYELKCQDGSCDCIADGDRQGRFSSNDALACDITIGEMKVLCGWNLGRGSQR